MSGGCHFLKYMFVKKRKKNTHYRYNTGIIHTLYIIPGSNFARRSKYIQGRREGGGPGGLLTLGPVVNHGARAALHYKWSVVALF